METSGLHWANTRCKGLVPFWRLVIIGEDMSDELVQFGGICRHSTHHLVDRREGWGFDDFV